MKKILLIVISLTIVLVAGAAGRKASPVSDADKRKADYIYMEALIANEDERPTDYYMLLRRAAELNPEDPYIAANLAEIDILLPTVDSAATMQAYRAIQKRFYLDPTVDANGEYYNAIAMRMRRYDDVIDLWELLDSIRPSRTDPAMNLAHALTVKGASYKDTVSLRRAVDIYSRLQETQPGNVELIRNKAMTLDALGDTTALFSELSRLSLEAPWSTDAMLFISGAYTSLQKSDSARHYLDRATELDPDDGRVRMMRATVFSVLGDSVGYRHEVRLALESQGLEYEQKFAILRDYVANVYNDSITSLSEIEHMFNTLEETNPGESTLHDLFGEYYEKVGRDSAAIEQFRFAIDLDQHNQAVYDKLIEVYGRLNDSIAVLEVARRAVELFPSDIYAVIMGASSLGQMDKNFEAIAFIDSLEVLDNHNPKALSTLYMYKGDLYARLEEMDSALVCYDRSINLDADNYMALNNAAYFMACQERDLPKAEIYASIATASDSDNPTYLDTYAWVLFMKGEYVRAKDYIDKALTICETPKDDESEDEENKLSPEILDHAGDIYFMNRQHSQAVEFWKRALELEPDNELIKKKVTNKAYYAE